MLAFVAESAADYDGYSVIGVFDTEAQAVAYAESRMAEFDDYTTSYKVSRWCGTTCDVLRRWRYEWDAKKFLT